MSRAAPVALTSGPKFRVTPDKGGGDGSELIARSLWPSARDWTMVQDGGVEMQTRSGGAICVGWKALEDG